MKNKIALRNGIIYSGYDRFDNHAILIQDDKVIAVVDESAIPDGYEWIDLQGRNVCPGLIDLQIYGTGNHLVFIDFGDEYLVFVFRGN
jgi:N-acetylglucosamine-6-phosphate deacetylase